VLFTPLLKNVFWQFTRVQGQGSIFSHIFQSSVLTFSPSLMRIRTCSFQGSISKHLLGPIRSQACTENNTVWWNFLEWKCSVSAISNTKATGHIGYWALKMWLVQLKNWIYLILVNLDLNGHTWLGTVLLKAQLYGIPWYKTIWSLHRGSPCSIWRNKAKAHEKLIHNYKVLVVGGMGGNDYRNERPQGSYYRHSRTWADRT
jgi:hypothetical protein